MLKLCHVVLLACGLGPLLGACSNERLINQGCPASGGPEQGGTSPASGAADSGGGASGGTSTSGTDGGKGASAGTDSGEGGAMSGPSCDVRGEGKEVVDLPGQVEFDLTMTSDKVWRVSGLTVVSAGATVSIEPCTRVVGDSSKVSALIFAAGSRIDAVGTAEAPIVFTSELPVGERKPGDWGGVALLGRAPINETGGTAILEGVPNRAEYRYGGDDAEDSSGSMEYVRIEYAGYAISVNSELNGLTLAGVGSGTKLSHIMVSNALDDCFEWFGGTVDADHLICNSDGDDMFDCDRGFQGTLSYLFGRKRENPSSDPNGFEWDNKDKQFAATPISDPKVKHATLCGFGFELGGSDSYGVVLRRGTWGHIDDWVEVGFDYGVDQRDWAPGQQLVVTNSTMFGNVKGDIVDPNDCNAPAGVDNGNGEFFACGDSPTWDNGFDEQAWFLGTDPKFPDNQGNDTDNPGFDVHDCQADEGPNAEVTGSGKGAFADGNWLQGAWIDWADR